MKSSNHRTCSIKVSARIPLMIFTIYLYEHSVSGEELNLGLQVLTEVKGIKEKGDACEIQCHQWQQDKDFTHDSEVVLSERVTARMCLALLRRTWNVYACDDKGRYEVEADYRLRLSIPNQIYVHSGISHSHGVGSTNLGLAVHRNKVIINHLTGKEVFPMKEKNVFQNFDAEKFKQL